MRVLLDDIEQNLAADSVGAAIAAAAELAERGGRMIVEVIVDGRPWSQQEIEQERAGPDSEVRLTSADPVELVSETLGDASFALADAAELQQAAGELLQAGQTAQAMDKLNKAVSIWLSVQQAVTMGAELMRIDLACFGGSAMAGPGPAAAVGNAVEVIASLNRQLQAMRAGLESGDTLALSDTLMYDLPPVVEQWQRLLDDLRRHVRGRGR
jgi:hypothetical protein